VPVLLRRLGLFLPVLAGVVVCVFLLVHLVPGDPAHVLLGPEASPEAIQALRHQLGLDLPWSAQFLRYVGQLLHGNLGRSITQDTSVAGLIAQRLPATLELAVAAMAIAIVLGVGLGALAATRPNSALDVVCLVFAQLGVSVPVFWLGILLMFAFAVELQWLPAIGRGPPMTDAFADLLRGHPAALATALAHLAMPAATLGLQGAALICRLVRASMIEALASDYIRTARAKGLRRVRIVLVHALANALPPALTLIGWQFGNLLGGAVLTETIFGWPGMGQLAVGAISQRDLPLVQGIALTLALLFCVVNLAVDLLAAMLDPRTSAA
jgi:peptide/nickel transport system permease protein